MAVDLKQDVDTSLPSGKHGGITAADARQVLDDIIDQIYAVQTNVRTANYTLVLLDAADTVVEMNVAGANTITVPPNSSVAFRVGTSIEICQVGAGQTTILAGAGVTINTASSFTTRARWSTIGLRKRATDEWVLSGDLT